VTVERVVDDIRPWSHLVRIPAHRVLAVVECPMGAHPGGLYAGALPVDGYGEDYEFWVDARAATRADDYDAWIRKWVLDVESQDQWVAQLGAERVAALRAKASPDSWRADEATYVPDLEAPVNAWERAAVWGARYLADRVLATDADAVLAGAGVANLSAWLGVELARARGSRVQLTAEIGLWGYDATPADPFVLNHRNFPTATMLTGGDRLRRSSVASTTTISCLGADRSFRRELGAHRPRPFLVVRAAATFVASCDRKRGHRDAHAAADTC
jgi:hypothetical protein